MYASEEMPPKNVPAVGILHFWCTSRGAPKASQMGLKWSLVYNIYTVYIVL